MSAASWLSRRRRRARPHRRYSGSDSTSRATNIVSRSFEVANTIIPSSANTASGKISVCSMFAAWASASPADPGASAARPVKALSPASRRRSANSRKLSSANTSSRPQMKTPGPSTESAPSVEISPRAVCEPLTTSSERYTTTVSTSAATTPTTATSAWTTNRGPRGTTASTTVPITAAAVMMRIGAISAYSTSGPAMGGRSARIISGHRPGRDRRVSSGPGRRHRRGSRPRRSRG